MLPLLLRPLTDRPSSGDSRWSQVVDQCSNSWEFSVAQADAGFIGRWIPGFPGCSTIHICSAYLVLGRCLPGTSRYAAAYGSSASRLIGADPARFPYGLPPRFQPHRCLRLHLRFHHSRHDLNRYGSHPSAAALLCYTMSSHTSDLVRDSKLDASIVSGATLHVYHLFSQTSRRRRVRTEDTWHRRRELGNGTYGRVWLEGCVSGSKIGQLRAVKEIPKEKSTSSHVDYARELEAMAKFSHDKVRSLLSLQSSMPTTYLPTYYQVLGW